MILLILILCAGVQGFLGSDKTCGIEAGTNLIYHNPWLVYLEFFRQDRPLYVRCAGTLVRQKFVITAAHCVTQIRFSRITALLGEYDITKQIDCVSGVCAGPAIRILVSDVIVHPDYDGRQHDIALLRLKEEAPYTDFIRSICLPSGPLPQDALFIASGWGELPTQKYYSPTKKIIVLPHWRKSDCQAVYKNYRVPEHVICAGGQEGIDTCRGDSGGPLALIRDRIELWGVTSTGLAQCGTKNYPGMYTNVERYVGWIEGLMDTG